MKHYRKNPRRITRKQMDDLKRWLAEFGDLSGIVHNLPTDEIIGGNQRSEALAGVMSGLIQPVITERFDPPQEDGTVCLGYYDIEGRRYQYRGVSWDDAKAERANLIANKAGGAWDFDILANEFEIPVLLESGFTEAELIGEGFDFGEESRDAEPQVDRAAELLEKWKVRTGDLWQIGEHKLICGDCTDAAVVARVMGGERAELAPVDPPYNVGFEYDGETVNDEKTAEKYEDFSRAWFGLCQSVSERQIVTPGCYNLASWLRWFDAFHWSPWTKSNSMTNGKVSRFWCWEPVLFFGEKWKRTRSNDLFDFPIGEQGGVANHPCPKPLKMWEDLIINYSEEGAIIYESFSGSGTTLVACQNLGRKCRAIEISPAYVAVALERMATAFPDLEIVRIEDD